MPLFSLFYYTDVEILVAHKFLSRI